MRAPAFWWRAPGLVANLLRPIGAVYGAIAGSRLRQAGEHPGVPVVCIGNPTLGGAGKTPTAIAVAALLAACGERPVFLTRGYGGSLPGPVRVDLARHGADDVGDEPLLLAPRHLTVVARDRPEGARLARADNAGVIVMDDGFQNPSLAKDFAVLVVDAARGIGNGLVFPAGPLRAPLAAQLQRAHAMVVIGTGEGAQPVIEAATFHGVPVFKAHLEPDRQAIAALHGRAALAFAGIGDPEKFFATLVAAGIDTPARRAYADHHRYREADAVGLLLEAERHDLIPVTTEKDFVRLAGGGALAALRERTRTLPVSLVFDDKDGFSALMLRRIRSGV